jgi:hypothetical protein
VGDFVENHRHQHRQRPNKNLTDDLLQDCLAGELLYNEYGNDREKTRRNGRESTKICCAGEFGSGSPDSSAGVTQLLPVVDFFSVRRSRG